MNITFYCTLWSEIFKYFYSFSNVDSNLRNKKQYNNN